MPHPVPSPLTAAELVDEYFIENRNRILELAAFLDRVDRADETLMGREFRLRALAEAIKVLLEAGPGRLDRIQMLLSDPTTELKPALDRKGAVGAFDDGGR